MLALVLVVACGGGSKKGGPDAASVLGVSATATKAVTSFHFRLNHENGASAMPFNLQLVSAEGDVAVPDRLSADVKAKASSVSASLKVISIGDKTWVTNPFSRRWQFLPDARARDFANPELIVNTLLTDLANPELVGQSEIDGVKTYEIKGTLDSGFLQAALQSVQPGHPVTVQLWIGVSDSLPRRARISGRLSDGEAENIVRQVDLSKFNAKVDIQPPVE